MTFSLGGSPPVNKREQEMRKLAIATYVLVALTSAASADFIQGTLSMWPTAIVSGTGDGQTIKFTGGQQFAPSFTSGDLTPFEASVFHDGIHRHHNTGKPVRLGRSEPGLRPNLRRAWHQRCIELDFQHSFAQLHHPHRDQARYDRARRVNSDGI